MSDSDRDSGSDRDKKPVVRARRRRPSGETPPGRRERAEAPRRRERDEQAAAPRPQAPSQQYRPPRPRPTSGQTGPRPSGSGLGSLGGLGSLLGGGSRRSLPILLIGALLVCCVAFVLLRGCGGLGSLLGGAPSDGGLGGIVPPAGAPGGAPTAAPTAPRATIEPFVAPPGAASGQNWLVMLYQDADDKMLEQDIYVDLNEAERVGSTDNVHIVAQIDRYAGGYAEDGNWTNTRRYYVTRDDDLTRVGSELVADMDEQNMADGETLVDFVTWAVETFPADRVALIMADHGMGWPGGWSDPAPATRGEGDTPLSSALGNHLYLDELSDALQTIRDRTGIDKLELIGMDACLMGQLEVYSAMAPHARYAVASEETEPGLGWAYTGFLDALARNPAMTGAELSRAIVDSYIDEDQRIVDDQARADLLRQGSPMGGLFGTPSSAEVADQMGRNITLSAVDLSTIPALVEGVNDLCAALQEADQRPVAQARNYAQSFTNVFGRQVPPAYIDLGHWAQLLRDANAGEAVSRAADGVLEALRATVVAERHGAGKPGASGVAIYFPNSQLYGTPATGPASYTAIANTLSQGSLWDDYLAYHYTGRAFDPSDRQPIQPEEGAAVAAPGRGEITLTPITLSDDVAAPGQPVLLSTDVTARNLGHIYLFAGYIDPQANSLYIADMDYLESADTREVEGVYYPVWPEEAFTLEFEWEPLMFAISDGVDTVTALLSPQTYGVAPEEAVYTVDGIYSYASGESRYARLYFRDGLLRQVYGFNGDDSTGAPWEIYPEAGDRFTVLEQWLDLDTQGRVVDRVTQEGGALTFGDQTFSWRELDAAVGDYVVGFIAEDLDGTRQQAYAQVRVE